MNKIMSKIDELLKQVGADFDIENKKVKATVSSNGTDIINIKIEVLEYNSAKIESEKFEEYVNTLPDELFEAVIDLIGEVLKSLQPLVNFIAGILTDVIKSVGETLQRTGKSLVNFFKGIRDIIQGIVRVIRGILTGDFKEIGRGLLIIFAGVLNAISGVVETVVNAITSVINQGIRFVWKLLSSFVNGILSGVNKVLDFIGMRTISWQMGVESPQIPRLSIPRVEVPAFASGGVVTGPTMGILGEAGRDEAVIPLDNSPQMRNFISEIVSAINNSKSVQDQPTVIKVFVGNEQLDEYIYKSQKRRDLRTNGG